jgi:hypothetical protein
MLNTYIKNRGTTKTIIYDNNRNHINEINWDANYDGDVANISIDTERNGKSKHYDIKLDNNDLANLLNIHSVNMPIDKRLKIDFDEDNYLNEPYYIELPSQPREPIIEEPETSIEELIDRRITTPKSNEIFLPLSIDSKAMNKFTYTPKKRHKRHKTHVTHKLIKKTKSTSTRHKSSKSSRHKSSKSKHRTYRSKSTPILDLLRTNGYTL